jgi:hypothetical protein
MSRFCISFALTIAVITATLATTREASAGSLEALTLTTPGDEYNGAYYTLGFSFTLSQNVTVTALGAYDSGQDGLWGDAEVGIWDENGVLLISTTVAAGTSGFLDGYFRYNGIAPFALSAATTYIIGAFATSDVASSYNTNQGGIGFFNPLVNAIEDRYIYNDVFAYPDSSNSEPGGAWLGANFQFSVVPEPSSLALLGIGGIGWGLVAYRRRKQANAEE